VFRRSEALERLKFIEAKSLIIIVNLEIALKATETYFEIYNYAKRRKLRTPSLVDAIVYATAYIIGVKLVTGDKLFREIPGIIYIGD